MGHVTSFIRAWRFKYSATESGCLLHMSYNAWQTMLGHVMRDRGPAWVKFWQVLWPWNSNKNSWNDDKRQQMGWKFNSDEVENKYNSKIPAGTWLPSQYKKWWVFKFWLERSAPLPPLRGFLSVIVIPSLDTAICLPKKETSQLLGLNRTCIPCALEWAYGDGRQLGCIAHTNLEYTMT